MTSKPASFIATCLLASTVAALAQPPPVDPANPPPPFGEAGSPPAPPTPADPNSEQPAIPSPPTPANFAPQSGVAGLRDPFWPIGYQPRPAQEEGPEEKVSIQKTAQWPELHLKGMTRRSDGSYMAIIQQVGLVDEGDIVELKHGPLVFRWKIDAITANGVSHKRLDVRLAEE